MACGKWLGASLCMVSALYADYSEIQGQGGDVTPLAGPVAQKWGEVNISADFIYWQPREEHLNFARDGVRGSVTKQGELYGFDFDYVPGFEAALGLNFKHDGWDLLLNYTWLQNMNGKKSVSYKSSQGDLDDLSLYAFTGSPTDNAVSSHWTLHFNALEWDLGRRFYISRFLALRPFIGLKGAWIDQKWGCIGSATVITQNDAFNNTFQDQQFWGVGLRGGTNLDFHITRNWSFYGGVVVDALYGQFQDTVLITHLDPTLASHAEVWQSQRYNIHTITPVLELDMGVRYETFFSQDQYQVFAQVGWVEQVWFDQNQFIVGMDSSGPSGGNLIFQGLDIKFGFTF